MADEPPQVQDDAPINAIEGTPPEVIPEEPATDKTNDPFTGKPDPNLLHHLGWLGRFAGGGPEKAGNIALVVIVAAIVLLLVALIVPLISDNSAVSPVADKMVTGGISLITGALGYLFGSSRN